MIKIGLIKFSKNKYKIIRLDIQDGKYYIEDGYRQETPPDIYCKTFVVGNKYLLQGIECSYIARKINNEYIDYLTGIKINQSKIINIIPSNIIKDSNVSYLGTYVYYNCSKCKSMMLEKGDFCPSCFEKNSEVCTNCGARFIPEGDHDMVVNNKEHHLCVDCVKKTDVCDHCCTKLWSKSLVHVDGDWVCGNCLSEIVDLDSCDLCGNLHPSNKLRGIGGLNMCPVCEHGYTKKPTIKTMNYSFKPEFNTFKTNENDESITMGIELEVLNKKTRKQHIINYFNDIINKKENVFYFKNDASIENKGSGIYGESFELVSHPVTYNWIVKNKNVIKSIMDLRKHGCLSYRAHTCGMHVHLGSNFFTSTHLYSFLKFIYENEDFTYMISDRVDRKWFEKFSTLKPPFDLKRVAESKVNPRNERNRHVAVNMSSGYTVEVRIFRGTLNYVRFMKNIEYCMSVYEYTKDEWIPTVGGYLEFISSRDYPNLKKILSEKGVI